MKDLLHRLRDWGGVILIVGLLGMFVTALARQAYRPFGDSEGVSQGQILMSAQIAWNIADTTTATGTEPTDLAVGERTYTTVLAAIVAALSGDEEISYMRIPPTWSRVRFRCIGTTENGAVTHQIYLGSRGSNIDCELAKAAQLAWIIGTQASVTTDYELADAVTVTEYSWSKTCVSVSPGGEMVAEAWIDVQGVDTIVIVPSATDTDCKLLAKGY